MISRRYGFGPFGFKTYSFNYPQPEPGNKLHITKGSIVPVKDDEGESVTPTAHLSPAEAAVLSGLCQIHSSEWFMFKTHTWRLINRLRHEVTWVTLAVPCTHKGSWNRRLMWFCNRNRNDKCVSLETIKPVHNVASVCAVVTVKSVSVIWKLHLVTFLFQVYLNGEHPNLSVLIITILYVAMLVATNFYRPGYWSALSSAFCH